MTFEAGLSLGEKIGEGYFGDVYKGHDHLHGEVAVKVLRPFADESEDEWRVRKDDLMGEAQRLKRSDHPNVVRVLNLVRHNSDGNLHMVTEFCDGGSVADEYHQGPIEIARVRRILTDVCLGIDYVHNQGMVHRDIKPGNMLCSGATWKISDFGIVSDRIVAGYASAFGYQDHMAYEVYANGTMSVKSDIWALGMTTYRLLHGHAFYQDMFGGLSVAAEVQKGGFALNLAWLPHVPKTWQTFIRKAMNDDPSQRFQNIHEFSQGLGRLPTAASWRCEYAQDRCVWTRGKNGRTIEVVRTRHSPRQHEWVAISKGGKRQITLASSSGRICRRDVDSGLRQFFLRSD